MQPQAGWLQLGTMASVSPRNGLASPPPLGQGCSPGCPAAPAPRSSACRPPPPDPAGEERGDVAASCQPCSSPGLPALPKPTPSPGAPQGHSPTGWGLSGSGRARVPAYLPQGLPLLGGPQDHPVLYPLHHLLHGSSFSIISFWLACAGSTALRPHALVTGLTPCWGGSCHLPGTPPTPCPGSLSRGQTRP